MKRPCGVRVCTFKRGVLYKERKANTKLEVIYKTRCKIGLFRASRTLKRFEKRYRASKTLGLQQILLCRDVRGRSLNASLKAFLIWAPAR